MHAAPPPTTQNQPKEWLHSIPSPHSSRVVLQLWGLNSKSINDWALSEGPPKWLHAQNSSQTINCGWNSSKAMNHTCSFPETIILFFNGSFLQPSHRAALHPDGITLLPVMPIPNEILHHDLDLECCHSAPYHIWRSPHHWQAQSATTNPLAAILHGSCKLLPHTRKVPQLRHFAAGASKLSKPHSTISVPDGLAPNPSLVVYSMFHLNTHQSP